MSPRVYPESVAMLQRPGAAVLERYLSSRSPPDHLLYQILKIVPVWGGGSDLIVEGSTCGRAGRRLRRMIVFVFLGAERESSVTVIGGEGCENGGELDGEICECAEGFGGIEGNIDVWTSAMIACVRMISEAKRL